MQLGFYFDQSRCIGCYNCVAACRSWNELDQDMPDLIEIVTQEYGEFPNLSLTHLFITCFHCAQPICIPACPEGLLVKRAEDGIVIITHAELCTGCELCVEAYPYDALKMVTGGSVKILKCNLCVDRISEGGPPACVAACPTEALEIGLMVELIHKYGGLSELDGFADYRVTIPSVVFRALSVKSSVT